MTIDEGIEALTMNLGLAHREIQDLKVATQQDAQNIRALAGIAETALDSIKRLENIATAHERHISRLEDPPR